VPGPLSARCDPARREPRRRPAAPSFATTVGFWQELGGDWSRGPEWRWKNALGWTVEDVGGRLLPAERARDRVVAVPTDERGLAPSDALRRVRAPDLPPPRGLPPDVRADRPHLDGNRPPLPVGSRARAVRGAAREARLEDPREDLVLTKKRGVAKREERLTRRNLELSEQVFAMIQADDEFFRRL
jgi:hypothetical protein